METVNERIEESSSCWYVVYTAVKSENKVKDWLEERGYVTYAPMQSLIRFWNSRKKQVTVPVLSRCVFVQLSSSEDIKYLSGLPGVFFMKEKDQYVTIPNLEMDTFRNMLESADEFICKGRSLLLRQMGVE